MYEYLMVIVQHEITFLIHIGPHQLFRSPYNCRISTFQPFTTAANRSKHIIIVSTLVNIRSLVCSSSNLNRSGTRLHSQSILTQFDGINTPETSPKQIFPPILFYIERIYGILHFDTIATKHHSTVFKRSFRTIGHGTTNTTGPFSSPDRHGIIQYIFIPYFIYVRSPDSSLRFKIRTCSIRKSSSHKFPVHQIFRTVNRKITYVFRSIKIEIPIFALYDGRVWQTIVNYRIRIFISCIQAD